MGMLLGDPRYLRYDRVADESWPTIEGNTMVARVETAPWIGPAQEN
jgi:hypothetical protein